MVELQNYLGQYLLRFYSSKCKYMPIQFKIFIDQRLLARSYTHVKLTFLSNFLFIDCFFQISLLTMEIIWPKYKRKLPLSERVIMRVLLKFPTKPDPHMGL